MNSYNNQLPTQRCHVNSGGVVIPLITHDMPRVAPHGMVVGGSTSYPSSAVAEDAVQPSDDDGIIGHHQENVNCNSKDASISIIPPRLKKTIHKRKPVVEKSQPGVKASIKKRWRQCSHVGCTNVVYKGGVCVTHGAKIKQCSYEGCNNKVKKGGVCVTHGAKKKQCSFEGCTNGAVQRAGRSLYHAWGKDKTLQPRGMHESSREGWGMHNAWCQGGEETMQLQRM
jgi:hypothetical protein